MQLALAHTLRQIDHPLLIVRAMVIAVAIHTLAWAVMDWQLHDLRLAYLPAAERVLSGEPLYGGDITPWTAYRYSPWFAYAITPLTLLPYPLVATVWSAFGLVCCGAVVWPLRHGGADLLVAVLLGAFLVGITTGGNVQAWLLALVICVPERWRPVAIGIAGSVKITFLPLALVYVARREWGRLAVSAGVAAVLWAPLLLFTVSPITFDPGGARTIPAAWWVIVAGSVGLGALAVSLRWPSYALLAGTVAGIMGTPRLYPYELTLLLIPASDRAAPTQG